jgi:hypothetical protein
MSRRAHKNMPPTSANELRRIESEKSAAFVADFCVCCCTGEYYIKRFAQSGAFLLAPSASRRLLENKHRERGVRADIEGNLCGECSVRMLIHTMGWRIATLDNGVLVLSAPIINTLSARVCAIYHAVMSHK